MIEVGRMVVKIAGRDAGKKAVIIDVIDDKYVMIDGEARRRKCNVIHLEPINQLIEIKKNASHDEVSRVFKELGIEAMNTKPKQKAEKPKAKRKTHEQIMVQKEDKRKLRDILKPKKKESSPAKETSLEAKAGLAEEKSEAKEAKPKADKPKKVGKIQNK